MKYSLRNFLIVFLVSIVIFSVAAVFLVDTVSDMLKTPQTEDAVMDPIINVQESAIPTEIKDTLSYLILGIGQNGRAEYLLLTHIDKVAKTFLVSDLPANLRIELDGTYQTLGDAALSRDIEFVREKVYALTAVKIDYLFSVEAHGFVDLVNRYGGFSFNVPVNMNQTDADRGIFVNLAAGEQHLDGEAALSVLQYSLYSENPALARSQTFRALMVAMAKGILGEQNNLMKTADMLSDVFSDFTTDMTMTEADSYLDTIFAFSSYELVEFSYPGKNEGVFFLPDTTEARELYKAYRK